jgi:uncharacterized damage-inducible protein DinB
MEAILLNLDEARRRSILIWKAIPQEYLNWKMDEASMSLIETVRHVLDGDEWYRLSILHRGKVKLDYDTIFGDRPYESVENELEQNRKARKNFIQLIQRFSETDLDTIRIHRSNGELWTLGKFLGEIAYHEGYHAGQLNLYLRLLNVPRPDIWN